MEEVLLLLRFESPAISISNYCTRKASFSNILVQSVYNSSANTQKNNANSARVLSNEAANSAWGAIITLPYLVQNLQLSQQAISTTLGIDTKRKGDGLSVTMADVLLMKYHGDTTLMQIIERLLKK